MVIMVIMVIMVKLEDSILWGTQEGEVESGRGCEWKCVKSNLPVFGRSGRPGGGFRVTIYIILLLDQVKNNRGLPETTRMLRIY